MGFVTSLPQVCEGCLFVGTRLGICGAINFNIRPIVRCTLRQHIVSPIVPIRRSAW